jgi:hypothetical protein
LADAALVRGDHVLDVDEGVLPAVNLKHFERLLDQVAEHEAFALPVVNAVAQVDTALLKEVHNGQQLPEVRHKGLTNCITARDQGLQNLKRNCHNLMVACIHSSYNLKSQQPLRALLLMGIISWGTTGSTLAPPFCNMSKTPWTAKKR